MFINFHNVDRDAVSIIQNLASLLNKFTRLKIVTVNFLLMHKLINPGRIMFATGMIGLAVLCFISKDFIVGRPPAWPAWLTLDPLLAYISGSILIVAAIAVLLRRQGAAASLLIAVLI